MYPCELLLRFFDLSGHLDLWEHEELLQRLLCFFKLPSSRSHLWQHEGSSTTDIGPRDDEGTANLTAKKRLAADSKKMHFTITMMAIPVLFFCVSNIEIINPLLLHHLKLDDENETIPVVATTIATIDALFMNDTVIRDACTIGLKFDQQSSIPIFDQRSPSSTIVPTSSASTSYRTSSTLTIYRTGYKTKQGVKFDQTLLQRATVLHRPTPNAPADVFVKGHYRPHGNTIKGNIIIPS
uniref:Uncharacterized protein n=1 Tax=Grammatophora oceanica TaxID=210454 RepID=A0A7S1UMH6_9STRA|mmetsp:Transcript_12752/g.18809  ORF Transcript_12752/g.18809 Transcript_12752/m.18809 type:complete len:239 (+) Transcript_12752:107-823(+)|eukprot:CAMPEP_0194068648 /NCGR_PEP_ID=MMETSP0009_2-20130614/87209_1 /TAXON_ID=210454 /ORGANISM="Grammatophora oceanica, Strain CCMP 410" /LENGTH=238 /DNA_ID=CAMNT_0038721765 /DNA_START=858 /DNA_END=1574 /DNA_ORIENTATION=-